MMYFFLIYIILYIVNYLLIKSYTKMDTGKWAVRDRRWALQFSLLGPFAFLMIIVILIVNDFIEKDDDKPANW